MVVWGAPQIGVGRVECVYVCMYIIYIEHHRKQYNSHSICIHKKVINKNTAL